MLIVRFGRLLFSLGNWVVVNLCTVPKQFFVCVLDMVKRFIDLMPLEAALGLLMIISMRDVLLYQFRYGTLPTMVKNHLVALFQRKQYLTFAVTLFGLTSGSVVYIGMILSCIILIFTSLVHFGETLVFCVRHWLTSISALLKSLDVSLAIGQITQWQHLGVCLVIAVTTIGLFRLWRMKPLDDANIVNRELAARKQKRSITFQSMCPE